MKLRRKIEGRTFNEVEEFPFTKKIEQKTKQKHIKYNNLNLYKEHGDPEEHLGYFNQLALLYEYINITRCQFFASTQRDGAQRWFSRVLPMSLQSLRDFKKAYHNKFK